MSDLQKLATIIKDIKFTMMTTISHDGSIYSRPMGTQKISVEDFDGKLCFFSKKNSPKVQSIQEDQHVNLAYANPETQQYVSVAGIANVTTDRATLEKYWNPLYLAWFPEGLNDPEISLIEVQVQTAEIWDAPPSKVVQLVGFLKGAITGRPYEKSHQTHINLRGLQ